jgi:hypothetical protein
MKLKHMEKFIYLFLNTRTVAKDEQDENLHKSSLAH